MSENQGLFGDTLAFTQSAGQGAWNAGSRMVEGLWDLANGGYKLATDAKARDTAWETTKQLAEDANKYGEAIYEEPVKLYLDARDGALAAHDKFEQARDLADTEGKSAEFWGEMAGGGAFEVATMLIPVGALAKAGKLGQTARVADEVTDVAEAIRKAENIEDVLAASPKAKGVVEKPVIMEIDHDCSAIQKCPIKNNDGNPVNIKSLDELGEEDRVKNPHPGLHNRDDLTLGKQDKFKTIRKIDMENLSEADEIAAKVLKEQGWKPNKIKEILSSGDSFRVKELKKGDKLYGIGTEGYSKDIKTSSYWLDEAGYNEVKDKFYKDGHWDKEGIKNNLALPCFNKANSVDQAVLTKSHTVVESSIGKATELIQYKGNDGYSTGLLGKIMGGGGTQIANDPTKIKSIP